MHSCRFAPAPGSWLLAPGRMVGRTASRLANIRVRSQEPGAALVISLDQAVDADDPAIVGIDELDAVEADVRVRIDELPGGPAVVGPQHGLVRHGAAVLDHRPRGAD